MTVLCAMILTGGGDRTETDCEPLVEAMGMLVCACCCCCWSGCPCCCCIGI
jgi:hypothetical protein